MAKVVEQDNLDGIDFDVQDLADRDIQLYVLKHCRDQLGRNKLISYTIPGTGELHEPYKSVLQQGSQYLDYVNVMCYDVYWSAYDPTADFQAIEALGVPKSKIVWGVMPGCHDAPNEYTSINDT